jgi:hypothetical protein
MMLSFTSVEPERFIVPIIGAALVMATTPNKAAANATSLYLHFMFHSSELE